MKSKVGAGVIVNMSADGQARQQPQTQHIPHHNVQAIKCHVTVTPHNDGVRDYSRRHSGQRESGFTLLEVLIALSIFAIMGLASYHLLSGEARTQQTLEAHSAQHNHWQRGMMRLTQDLQQAVNRSIRADYGNREPALIGESDSLTFTRQGWSNPLQQTRSELQRVDYRVATAGDDASYLQRSFWFPLDRAPASEPIPQQLLPGIEYLQLRYYHPEKKTWLNQWPPLEEPTIGLPQAIEVTLTSAEHGQLQRLVALTLNRRPQS